MKPSARWFSVLWVTITLLWPAAATTRVSYERASQQFNAHPHPAFPPLGDFTFSVAKKLEPKSDKSPVDAARDSRSNLAVILALPALLLCGNATNHPPALHSAPDAAQPPGRGPPSAA